jgi:hypothetical protein
MRSKIFNHYCRFVLSNKAQWNVGLGTNHHSELCFRWQTQVLDDLKYCVSIKSLRLKRASFSWIWEMDSEISNISRNVRKTVTFYLIIKFKIHNFDIKNGNVSVTTMFYKNVIKNDVLLFIINFQLFFNKKKNNHRLTIKKLQTETNFKKYWKS